MRGAHTNTEHTWRSEDYLVELVLLLHLHVGSGGQSQVATLVQWAPLLTEPSDPFLFYFSNYFSQDFSEYI